LPYRIKFVREYFGERMSIQTESTELSNGSHKFKANIYLDDKLVSVGESKQMKNADKEFEKQQTVSIGRGLSILGFFGDEISYC
jgi:acyl-CoA thioesterase FadM